MAKGRKGWTVPATPALIGRLMAYIPSEDNEDMIHGWGMSSEQAMMSEYLQSPESFVILAEGDSEGETIPVGIVGCREGGAMWMMRGEDIPSVAIQFIRQSQPLIARWLEQYGHLTCYFRHDLLKLKRFLEWSGFTVTDLGGEYWGAEKWAQR